MSSRGTRTKRGPAKKKASTREASAGSDPSTEGAKKGAARGKKAGAREAGADQSGAKRGGAKRGGAKRGGAAGSRASKGEARTRRAGAAKAVAREDDAPPTPDAEDAAAADPREGLEPVRARPSRSQRAGSGDRLREIDEVCNAWADIVAERVAADQTFADLVEQYNMQPPRDLRGLILWDALQAAEAHVALITAVLAEHLDGRRGDPVQILAELRARQRQIAAVYAVNAFLAVLNQMNPDKPKWLSMDFVDARFAVLALAHQTLRYALETARVDAPNDLTEQIIEATQDPAVWVWRRMPERGTDTLAACAAAAAFFRALGAEIMTSTDEVAALYAAHSASLAAE